MLNKTSTTQALNRSVLCNNNNMSRPDPFGNRIEEVMEWDATDDLTDYTGEDGLDAATLWDLPEAFACIIRSEAKSGKITEKAYRSLSAAKKHVLKCMKQKDQVLILTDSTITVPISPDDPNAEPF